MTTAAAPFTFKGYKAVLTNDKGQSSPCYVVNQRMEMKFNDGTTGHAFKVRVGYNRLLKAGHRYEVSYSADSIWVKSFRVSV